MTENEILNEEPTDGKTVCRGNGAVNNHQSIGICNLGCHMFSLSKHFLKKSYLHYLTGKEGAIEFKLINKKTLQPNLENPVFLLPTFVYIFEQVKVLTANLPSVTTYRVGISLALAQCCTPS